MSQWEILLLVVVPQVQVGLFQVEDIRSLQYKKSHKICCDSSIIAINFLDKQKNYGKLIVYQPENNRTLVKKIDGQRYSGIYDNGCENNHWVTL